MVSFHQGYTLWKRQIETAKMPYDLEQVLAGIRAADRGDPMPISEEEIVVLMMQYQEEWFDQISRTNLIQTERILEAFADDPEAIESVPMKLYYKVLKQGSGDQIGPEDTPFLTYAIKTLADGKEKTVHSIETPTPICLPDAIPGLAKGVSGMLEGERRLLFIHPELGQGALERVLAPNQLIILDVTMDSKRNRDYSKSS